MTDGDTENVELWSVAERLADAAREETLRHFRARNLTAESKSEHFDPVTIADRNAESSMRAILGELRPEDGILGEEFGPKQGVSGLTWVLDPIDGTRGFISGTPTWGVLIALADVDGPILGLIDQPYIGERFMGGRGRAVLEGPHGNRRLSASGTTSLADATLFTTFPEVGTAAEAAAFRRVSRKVQLTRYGCAMRLLRIRAARGWPGRSRHRSWPRGLRHPGAHCRDRGSRRNRQRLGRKAGSRRGQGAGSGHARIARGRLGSDRMTCRHGDPIVLSLPAWDWIHVLTPCPLSPRMHGVRPCGRQRSRLARRTASSSEGDA